MVTHEALTLPFTCHLAIELFRAQSRHCCRRTHSRPRAGLSLHVHAREQVRLAEATHGVIWLSPPAVTRLAQLIEAAGTSMAIRNRSVSCAQPVPRGVGSLGRAHSLQATQPNLGPRRRPARPVLPAARRLPTGRPGPRRRPRRLRSRERRRSVRLRAGVTGATRRRSGYGCSSERAEAAGRVRGHRIVTERGP